MSPYALGLELTLLLACWLAVAIWQKDPATPGRVTFILLAASAAAWCFGELASVRGTLEELAADRIKYAGILCLPALWLGLASQAARLDMALRVPWFPLVLLAPLAFAYALLYSPAWGGLFVATIPGEADARGPIWWLVAFYNYTLVLAGSGILLVSAVRERRTRTHWRGQLALALAACVPLSVNAAYVAEGLTWAHDPTPVLLGVTLLALHSAVFSGALLQLLPLSQYDLVQQLPLGVLLTDRHGTVMSVNPAAEARLGRPAVELVGRDLDALLNSLRDRPRIETAPVASVGRQAGQIVMLDLTPAKPDPPGA